MDEYITVPSLDRWQHYKERNPPWIKLHRDVFNDYDFACLHDASKAHLLGIWLLASQMENKIPNDAAWIAKRINANSKVDIESLQSAGFIKVVHSASAMLANGKQNALAETETETETETEKDIVGQQARPPIPYSKIISFLNKTAGKRFKATDATKRKIRARINEGFSVDDFKAVISFKTDEWLTSEKMVQYVRPETLFGTKFESYLQAAKAGCGVNLKINPDSGIWNKEHTNSHH